MTDIVEISVPALPESVADATVAAVHVQVGDTVQRDQVLFDLETDKVILEVPAPFDGVVAKIDVAVDDVVNADAVLAGLERGEARGVAAAPARDVSTPAYSSGRHEAASAPSDTAGDASGQAVPKPAVASAVTLTPVASSASNAGPGARRAAYAGGAEAPPVSAAADRDAPKPASQPRDSGHAPKDDAVRRPNDAFDAVVEKTSDKRERREPMSRIRARIAERLLAAQQGTAMLTTFNEVDMSSIQALRGRHREAFQQRHGVKLGFMGFFIRAVTQALGALPIVNARIDGADIVHPAHCDVGIAVATPRGLIVPVIRRAETLSLAAIEQSVRDFADRGREGRVTLDEMQGGTFSITNGGVFGSLLSTPILNAPQSAILGMHAIQDRPIAVDGQVVVRPMMYLALSYDHRLIDGADAVRFLVHVKDCIEDPARLLLDL